MVSQFLLVQLLISGFSCTFLGKVEVGNLTWDELFKGEDLSELVRKLNENSSNKIEFLTQSEELVVGKDQEKLIKLDEYMNFEELKVLLDKLAAEYEDIVKVSQLGLSAVDHTPIYAVQISRNVQEDREMLKPMFKFVANIDGDDAVGYFLMTTLIQMLAHSYGYDERVSRLLNTTDIWIVPTMNPDGLRRSKEGCNQTQSEGKGNGKGIDLDIDFPDKPNDETTRQPETSHMLEFITSNPFVLSGNLQGGAIVASYFLEDNVEGTSDDREVFEKLAKTYAEQNERMANGTACDQSFPGGISDGNNLGKKAGSMQYANYVLSNCFELVLHLSCCKHPPASELATYWDENVESMLTFMESTRRGIYGLVRDKEGNPIREAVIRVVTIYTLKKFKDNKGNSIEEPDKNTKIMSKLIKGTDRGEYWRPLPPGSYLVTARAPACFDKVSVYNVLLTEEDPYVQLDFNLTRQGVHGVVTDQNGDPVEADLKVEQLYKGKLLTTHTKTNEHGKYFQFLNLSEPVYLKATAKGYVGYTKLVTVTPKKPYIKLNILLYNWGLKQKSK